MSYPAIARKFGALVALAALLVPFAAQADRFQRFGPYSVHYIAFNTTELDKDVARRYGINRSAQRAFLNISVLKDAKVGLPKGVPAKLSGTATNIIEQQRELEFREFREGEAVYYIATLQITDDELYRFRIQVQPVGESVPFELKFEQKVYVEND